jgi:hypothetical protein
LSFDRAAIDSWATFSDDYNPIHFDKEVAQSAGFDRPIVHGMLVMLPVKQALAERQHLIPNIGREWVRVRSSLKKSVPEGAAVSVSFTPRADRIAYSICGKDDGTTYIQGSMDGRHPPAPDGGIKYSRVQRLETGEPWQLFSSSFPGVKAGWVWLDALAFSHFVRRLIPLIVAKIGGYKPDWSFRDGLPDATVVQSSHTIWFRPDLLASLPMPDEADLDCTVEDFAIQHDGDRSYGNVPLLISAAGQLVMRQEIGLMRIKRSAKQSVSLQ